MKTRYFNQIEVKDGLVHKISKNRDKLRAEYHWLSEMSYVNSDISSCIPESLSFEEHEDSSELVMKYYPEGDLGQIYLKEEDEQKVRSLIRDCIRLFDEIVSVGVTRVVPRGSLLRIYVSKTVDRLKNNPFLSHHMIINGERYGSVLRKETMEKLIQRCVQLAYSCSCVTVIHGDFFLSNILKDGDRFRVIDPRGDFGGMPLHGDPRYDLAKLRHSISGGYDYIINDQYSLDVSENETDIQLMIPFRSDVEENTAYLDQLIENELGFNIEDVKLIEALLFLTMIPLHSDDRQRQLAFMAIAMMKLRECGVV